MVDWLHQVVRQAVHQVIDRKWISNRIMEAVAKALSREKEYVFPEYFLKKKKAA